MTKLTGALDHRLRQLGWPGVAGIGMLLFSASFYLSANRPAAEEAALLRGTIATHVQARTKNAGDAAHATAQSRFDAFYANFPSARELPDQLSAIYGLATKQGLRLQQGEYRLIHEGEARLERYEATLPLRGSYAQIRQFVAEVLNEMPAVSLDDVKFEKQQIGDSTIEAQVRITLFLLADGKGKAQP